MPDEVRREHPALSLRQVAVCLHFVETTHLDSATVFPYPNSPVLRSMELDLLSYRFQAAPPFGSEVETHQALPVEIVFPAQLEYSSEGRRVILECTSTVRPARLLVSSTLFLQSGMRVWHAVLAPEDEVGFNEFDIIKLIHLYDGRTEDTRLDEEIRFRFRGAVQGASEVNASVGVHDLIRAVQPRIGSVPRLRAGTVQIADDAMVAGTRTLPELLAIALAVPHESTGPLSDWMGREMEEAKALKACCGIVSGILDFDNLDSSEILDTLEPTVKQPEGLLRIHKGTVTSISGADRIMLTCADKVGISPYVILPHAALIHNECMVDAADEVLSAARAKQRASLRALEAAQERSELLLNRLHLPNVFHYRFERELFARGSAQRGSDDRRVAALKALEELSGKITRDWEARRDVGQMCIAALLAVLSVLQVKDFVLGFFGSGRPAGWYALDLVVVLVVVLIIALWRRGMRR